MTQKNFKNTFDKLFCAQLLNQFLEFLMRKVIDVSDFYFNLI